MERAACGHAIYVHLSCAANKKPTERVGQATTLTPLSTKGVGSGSGSRTSARWPLPLRDSAGLSPASPELRVGRSGML